MTRVMNIRQIQMKPPSVRDFLTHCNEFANGDLFDIIQHAIDTVDEQNLREKFLIQDPEEFILDHHVPVIHGFFPVEGIVTISEVFLPLKLENFHPTKRFLNAFLANTLSELTIAEIIGDRVFHDTNLTEVDATRLSALHTRFRSEIIYAGPVDEILIRYSSHYINVSDTDLCPCGSKVQFQFCCKRHYFPPT